MAQTLPSEIISVIEVLESGEIILVLEGQGDPFYQHIYREAAGVYWDPKRHGFRSTKMKEWDAATWFSHIVDLVDRTLGVKLALGPSVEWRNVPEPERLAIETRYAT